MMATLEEAIQEIINNTNNKVIQIIQEEHPKVLADLAKDIFQSEGQVDGRNWQSNKSSTAKRKGFNQRNYETGDLYNMLTEPGFLENDNYMMNLPSPKRGNSYGYQAANDINNGANRFDDIGQIQKDKELIDKALEKVIVDKLKE